MGHLKLPLYALANIQRGTTLSDSDKTKPKDMFNIKKVKVLTYGNLLPLCKALDLKNTIDESSTNQNDIAYINMNNKQNNCLIQKEDIVLPISNYDYEPIYINWQNSNEMDYIYHQKTIILRAKTDRILPLFLYFLLTTDYIKNYFRENAKEGNRYRLVCKTVMDLEVSIPSIEKQKKYIELAIKNNEERLKIYNMFEDVARN